jgi:hypothetical protein
MAIGAPMIGCATPNISVNRVVIMTGPYGLTSDTLYEVLHALGGNPNAETQVTVLQRGPRAP